MDLIGIRWVIGERWEYQPEKRILFEAVYEQVKKTRSKTFYFNKESKYELSRLKEITEKFKIPCFFAIKFTYKGWKIINVNELDGGPIKYGN